MLPKLNIVGVINLDEWYEKPFELRLTWLHKKVEEVYKPRYGDNDVILAVLTVDDPNKIAYNTFRVVITDHDISPYFIRLLTNDETIKGRGTPQEPVDEIYVLPTSEPKKQINEEQQEMKYRYNAIEPINISLDEIPQNHRDLLVNNKTFCIYPWIHLHAYPTGEAWPCCHAEMSAGPAGTMREQSLKELWNSDKMKELRRDMLAGNKNDWCTRCYEQEESGFFSGRLSANKHHGHHIARVDETTTDGTLDRFEMTYWDIRFSNLCNLKCRSCGHIFSSSWYQDQVALAGPEWAKSHKPLFVAGKDTNDALVQLLDHVDHVEQIYFAGGEPLQMAEHYAILDELEKREMFHVRLIYNTNFTNMKLKDREVFDYWRKFDSVAVGASLDAMGNRAEYIRAGTKWDEVEANRRRMMEVCPNVDFYISATLSIMNLWHLPEFHRNWVNKGFIKPQDFNINILQDPKHYRIDIGTTEYKEEATLRYEEHLDWLAEVDTLERAKTGFESAITYMNATDNSELLHDFWAKTNQLDAIRKESVFDAIPEMVHLQL